MDNFLDEEIKFLAKPVSFLDDSIQSIKPSEIHFKNCTPLQSSLLRKLDSRVNELLMHHNLKIVEVVYNKLVVLDTRDEKVLQHQRNRIHLVFKKWACFKNFCKTLKYKHSLVVESIQNFRLKYCFDTLKALLKLRAKRLSFEQKRKDSFTKNVFKAFIMVIKKSIKLGRAYVEVAVNIRQNIAKEALYKWHYLTVERIKAKEAIQTEIQQQKQIQLLELEREREEKNKIQQFFLNFII